MPVTKQAIKKVRQDKRKALINLVKRKGYKSAVKDFLKNPTEAALKKVSSALDRAAKVNVIHRNKASRLKSRLSKKLSKGGKSTASVKSTTKPKSKKKKSSKKSSK